MSEHSERYLGNPTQTVLFIIGCILIIFSLSSLILIICSIYHHDKNKISRKQALKRKWKSVKSVNYPTILSATFYFLSTCSYLAALYYFDDEAADNFGNSFRFVIAMVTFVAFIFAAKISIYTQFVARLVASFKNSYLEPSKCTLKVCITLLTLSWCTIIWWIILLSVRYFILKAQFHGYYTQFYFVFSLLFIFDFTMSWLVVGLFTKKLFATMMLKDRGHKIKNNVNSLQLNVYGIDGNDGNDWTHCTESMLTDICATTIDEDDQRRLNLIRKQAILSAITICTSQLSYISLLIILIIKNTAGYNDNFQPKLYALYAGAFYPMDVIINCIILYFNYRFADKYYHVFCCCFERVCKNCAIKYMAKRIVKQYNDESMNDYVIMTDQNNQLKNVCCCPSLCSNGNDKDSAQSHIDDV
eukprot:148575_1